MTGHKVFSLKIEEYFNPGEGANKKIEEFVEKVEKFVSTRPNADTTWLQSSADAHESGEFTRITAIVKYDLISD